MFRNKIIQRDKRRKDIIYALIDDYSNRFRVNLNQAYNAENDSARREFLLYANTYQNIVNDLEFLIMDIKEFA